MKKLLGVVMVLAIASGLYGQMAMNVGAKGGVNYDIMSSDVEGADDLSGLGYNFGIGFGIMPMPMLAIDLDAAYFIAKYKDTDYEMTINGFYFPLSLRYMFMSTPTMSPYVKAGAAMVMQQSGTYTEEGDTVETDIPDDLLETDFYILGGLGVDVVVAPSISIRPDAVFQYNLTAGVDEDDGEDSISAYDIVFTVGFYYHF